MTEQEKYQAVKEFGDDIIHYTEFFQTYYNPKAEEVLFVLPNSTKGIGEQKLTKPLLNENGWIRKIKFLYEEFPTKDSGFHLVSNGSQETVIEEVVETTTTIAPEIAKRDQMLIPIQTKFPCGNFRANPDDPKSIIGSRKNGANYEVVVPPDLRENFIYLLNQVNTLLNL
ncbi:MAG: hypothetical protein ACK6DA_11910 [Candidatus Kapaibacterium sp.]